MVKLTTPELKGFVTTLKFPGGEVLIISAASLRGRLPTLRYEENRAEEAYPSLADAVGSLGLFTAIPGKAPRRLTTRAGLNRTSMVYATTWAALLSFQKALPSDFSLVNGTNVATSTSHAPVEVRRVDLYSGEKLEAEPLLYLSHSEAHKAARLRNLEVIKRDYGGSEALWVAMRSEAWIAAE